MRLIPTQLRERNFEFYLALSKFLKLPYKKRIVFRRRYHEAFASSLDLKTSSP